MSAEIRFAVEQVMARYCHAVDRCDLAMLGGVFWDDALVDYGPGPLPAPEFCPQLIAALRSMGATQHNFGNMLLCVAQDRLSARVQTNCVAFHLVGEGADRREMEVGGRYLDRFDLRGDEWRISFRKYVMDWNRNGAATTLWDGPFYSTLAHRGTKGSDDPSTAFLA